MTAPAARDTRKATTAAMSSTASHSDVSASGIAARFCGVSIVPGRMQLAVMPSALFSSDSASVMRSSAALDAA